MCCKRARPHKGRPTSLIRDIRDWASGGNQTYEASHPSRARPSEPNSTPPTGPAGLLMQPETASAINTGGPLHEARPRAAQPTPRPRRPSACTPAKPCAATWSPGPEPRPCAGILDEPRARVGGRKFVVVGRRQEGSLASFTRLRHSRYLSLIHISRAHETD